MRPTRSPYVIKQGGEISPSPFQDLTDTKFCTLPPHTLAELAIADIDFRQVTLVMDKGYGSNTNWDDMLRNNMSFICNARRNLNGAVTDIIDENYAALLNWNNGVSYLKQNAVTVPIVWHYDEFPVAGKRAQKQTKATLYVHLYFSKDVAVK